MAMKVTKDKLIIFVADSDAIKNNRIKLVIILIQKLQTIVRQNLEVKMNYFMNF